MFMDTVNTVLVAVSTVDGARVLDAITSQEIASVSHNDSVQLAVFARDGTAMSTTSVLSLFRVKVCDLSDGKVKWASRISIPSSPISSTSLVTGLALSPDGTCQRF